MGEYKLPMILISLIVVALVAYTTFLKFSKSEINASGYHKSMNSILVFGSFNVAFGMLAQIIGIWDAIEAIKEAADINPDIVMEGIKISFSTTIYGLATFMFATIAWIILSYLPGKK